MLPAMHSATRTAGTHLKLRWVKSRWYPRVMPSIVTAYIPPQSIRSRSVIPRPQNNTTAPANATSGVMTVTNATARSKRWLGWAGACDEDALMRLAQGTQIRCDPWQGQLCPSSPGCKARSRVFTRVPGRLPERGRFFLDSEQPHRSGASPTPQGQLPSRSSAGRFLTFRSQSTPDDRRTPGRNPWPKARDTALRSAADRPGHGFSPEPGPSASFAQAASEASLPAR